MWMQEHLEVGTMRLITLQSVRNVSVGLGLALSAGAFAAPSKVGMLEIDDAPLSAPSPFSWLGGAQQPTLLELVNAIEAVGTRSDLAGLMIRLKDAPLSMTQVQELGEAIAKVRAQGKAVHVFAEAYGQTDLALASYASDVMVQNGGPVSLPGVHMEEMFLADTLSWVGLKADMVQVGDYKGASEAMARNAPSPQWEQNINQLLDSMYANLRSQIMAGRKMDNAKLDTAMKVAWMADGADAVRVGLVDRTVDLASLTEELAASYPGDVAWDSKLLASRSSKMDASNPFAMLAMLSKKPDHTPKGPTIAVLHIDGAIVDGDSTGGGLLGGEGSVGSRTIRRAIEEILDQDKIEGVVVRIDSPGGSATASEMIWQGLRRLAAKKPVWASIGSMAASGGYYCAVGTDKIYVNPSSIVGSIGVVGGKISMAGLYDKVKVRVFSHSRGPAASMFRSTTDWTPEELTLVRAKMTETYDQFTKRVTSGRPGIDLAKTAEGRLFTGDKAIGLKMADSIGGLDTTIEHLAKSLDLDDYDVMHYPGPKSFDEIIEDMMKQFVSAPGVKSGELSRMTLEMLGVVRDVVGHDAWPSVRANIEGMMQLRREPVLLMNPRAIVVR
jgi:protease IV